MYTEEFEDLELYRPQFLCTYEKQDVFCVMLYFKELEKKKVGKAKIYILNLEKYLRKKDSSSTLLYMSFSKKQEFLIQGDSCEATTTVTHSCLSLVPMQQNLQMSQQRTAGAAGGPARLLLRFL